MIDGGAAKRWRLLDFLFVDFEKVPHKDKDLRHLREEGG
jgi:hypothetical protein